jgi:hypothetical protein
MVADKFSFWIFIFIRLDSSHLSLKKLNRVGNTDHGDTNTILIFERNYFVLHRLDLRNWLLKWLSEESLH